MLTINQNRQLHLLLHQTGLTSVKQELIEGFSGGRTTSSRDLQPHEAGDLIRYLSTEKNKLENQRNARIQGAMNNMRRKIIAIAYNLHWTREDGKADMERINNWCIKNSYLHKKLNAYSYAELPKLVSEMELVYKSYLKTRKKTF